MVQEIRRGGIFKTEGFKLKITNDTLTYFFSLFYGYKHLNERKLQEILKVFGEENICAYLISLFFSS